MKPMLTLLVLGLAMAAGATRSNAQGAPQETISTLEMASLEMIHYTPEHEAAEFLVDFLKRSVGRSIRVAERGTHAQPVQTVSLLGQSIVLYDEPDQNRRVLAALERLDVPATGEEPVDHVTLRYALEHVSSDTARRVLSPLQDRHARFVALEDQRAVELYGSPAGVARMRDVLLECDVPEEQFRIQLLLLRAVPGSPGDSAGTLPAELRGSMAELLPGFRFELIGTAVLQSGGKPSGEVELGIASGAGGTEYRFGFRPVAYDPTTGDLTVQECVLHLRRPRYDDSGVPIGAEQRMIFRTTTILAGGEYTVIGGAGAEPVLAVVRVAPVH